MLLFSSNLLPNNSNNKILLVISSSNHLVETAATMTRSLTMTRAFSEERSLP
jgi:hypothetical protein